MLFLITFQASFHPKNQNVLRMRIYESNFHAKTDPEKSNAQKNEINETKERKLNCIMKSR